MAARRSTNKRNPPDRRTAPPRGRAPAREEDRRPMDEDPTGAETQAHPGHPALDAGMRGATSHSEPGGAAPEEITTDNDVGDRLEGSPPYSGPAGGAVGGTPARGRATERTGRGFRPGGDHRPDTTIGAQP